MLTNTEKNPGRQMTWDALTLRTRKWRNLTRFQKKWIMEKVHRQYRQFVEKNHRIPHRADRRILIENLCCQIYSRGIMIYKGEVVRVVDHRMRKWNRRGLEKKMEIARQVHYNGSETAE